MSIITTFLVLITLISQCPSVVVVGDSNGVLASHLYPDKEYFVFNGWSAKEAADDNRFEEFSHLVGGKEVVIRLGTNDIWDYQSYPRSLDVLTTKIINRGGKPILVRVPNYKDNNWRVNQLNADMMNIASRKKITFVYYESLDSDLTDGVHLNYNAQKKIDDAINNVVCR